MESFEAVVIGAGPAGGQCARALAESGKKVLLVEKNSDFTINNYSSAGAPKELMSDFSLPENIVGSSWNKIQMHSSTQKRIWDSPDRAGVIMDFAKLKIFLAGETDRFGGKVFMGWSFDAWDGREIVTLKNNHERMNIATKVLIDASGGDRRVLGKNKDSFPSTGIEHLVEVDDATYHKWEKSLSVFMGSEWMPQGYAWIFPMEKNRLKVGIGRYYTNQRYVPMEDSFQYYLENLKDKCLNKNHVKVLDQHGKTIHYTPKRNDTHYKNNCLAIGDAISMINPLGFEGIRHAMVSGKIAAKHVNRYLDGNEKAFSQFKREISSYCSYKWTLSEFLMKKIYLQPDDKHIELLLESFAPLSFDEMIQLAFHYRWKEAAKFYLRYRWKKLFA